MLAPALKYLATQQSPIGRAVLHSTLTEDLYLILSGWSRVGRGEATLKMLVRPLVAWIWLGGGVMTLGTIMALWPIRVRVAGRVAASEAAAGRQPLAGEGA